jgi:hypothetical protein
MSDPGAKLPAHSTARSCSKTLKSRGRVVMDSMLSHADVHRNERTQNKKGRPEKSGRPLDLIPATTYVPTQLPVQYHRPYEA